MIGVAWKLLWLTAMAGAVFWLLERQFKLRAVDSVWIAVLLVVGAALLFIA